MKLDDSLLKRMKEEMFRYEKWWTTQDSKLGTNSMRAKQQNEHKQQKIIHLFSPKPFCLHLI